MAQKIIAESQIGRRLRLRDLNIFFSVVRQGSMARAASDIGISQPAVSEVIANLEHAMGVRLLDRSSSGVEPTIYGQVLLKRGLAAFDELKQGVRDIEYLADPTGGELRIGCVDSISAAILPSVIQQFSARYPGVVLHVDEVPAPTLELPGLRERKYDLILGRLLMPLPKNRLMEDLNIEFLFNDDTVVAAGAHSVWARRRKIDLAELAEVPWILTALGTRNYTIIEEAFRARGLSMPKVRLVTFSVHLRTNLVANGNFVTAFPKSVLQLNADPYALKMLPVDLPVRPWPVVVITLKNRTLSPVAQNFVDQVRSIWAPAVHVNKAQ